MRDSVFCAIPPDADRDGIRRSVADMRERVAQYVPGYRLRGEPDFDDGRVAVFPNALREQRERAVEVGARDRHRAVDRHHAPALHGGQRRPV